MKRFEITFLGTNGSCAYNNGVRVKYGTNTLCVAAVVGEETLIFDTGTGICGFSGLADYHREHLRMFYTHYHVDHLEGLLFFSELFDPRIKIDIYGLAHADMETREILGRFLSKPYQPVGLGVFKANINYHTIAADHKIELSGGVTVRTYSLSHPGGAIGYRVDYEGKSFCYCSDAELSNHRDDKNLIEFLRGAELLVLDSAFDDGEVIPGWGHSSWRECAILAKEAEVKQLALYHHGYTLTDAEIDTRAKKAQKIFPGTFASADGMKVILYPDSV